MNPKKPFSSVPVHHKGQMTKQPAPRVDAEDRRDGGRDEKTEKS